MSRLYLYAIVEEAPTAPLGGGLRDEPLALLRGGHVVAVVGEMDEPPAATSPAVLGHDAVVRRLAGLSEAILPARFGTVREMPALVDWLASVTTGLEEALRLVAGREQMTLHVFDGDDPATPRAAEELDESAGQTPPGPGARYLVARRRHWRQRESLPELEPLRPRLHGLVAAERVEHRATPPFRASVYHLIERGQSHAYREVIETNLDLLARVRLRLTGPWPPYAFAPATLQ
jgi:hypothetical protein